MVNPQEATQQSVLLYGDLTRTLIPEQQLLMGRIVHMM